MAHTHLTVDPKTFIKAGPRTNHLAQQQQHATAAGSRTIVLPSSMINFEGEDVKYGRVGYVRKGNLEAFLQLVYVGASTNLMKNKIADKHITVLEGEGFLVRDQELIVLTPGVQVCIPFNSSHRIYSHDNFVLLSVVQHESYKNTEELEEELEKEGLPPPMNTVSSRNNVKEQATLRARAQLAQAAVTNPVKNTMPGLGNSITGLGGDDVPYDPFSTT